jgi:recombination protein RecT
VSNAVATLGPSPVEDFVGQVLDSRRFEELRQSLPQHIKPELFQRNLLNAVMSNYELMDYTPGLLFREVSKAAALGLFLDPQLGEAYLMVAHNYKTKVKEPQLRIGYRGLIKLARQSGEIRLIYAHEVCANDYIECRLGDDKSLIHKPELFTDRGPIVGYYAVIKYANGEVDFEPMSAAQIHEIRDRSDSYKAFKEGKIKSSPWSTDESEMAKKTTIRRIAKRAPQSPELAEAIRIEDAAEHSDFVRGPKLIAPPPPRPPSPPKIEHRPAAHDTPEPGIEERATQQEAPSPPKPPTPPKPPAPVVQQPHDPEKLRKWFEGAVRTCTTFEEIDELWNEKIAPFEHFPGDFGDLQGMRRRREHEMEG